MSTRCSKETRCVRKAKRRQRLPVFELLILVQEFDWDMAVGFLQHRRSTLVEGLDLVDDCRAIVLVIDQGLAHRAARASEEPSADELTERSPEHSSSDFNVLIRQMPQITPRSDIHMKPQIYDHTESVASINPSSTRLITQRKQRVTHQQERLDSSDITIIKRSPQQITDSISELPASSADIGRYFAELKARAELCCAKVDGVQQDAGEVGATGSHVPHEGWAVGDHEGVMLSIPVEV